MEISPQAPPPLAKAQRSHQRLSLLFLFAWITFTALLMSLGQFVDIYQLPSLARTIEQTAIFLEAAVYGLCCATWLYVFRDRWQSPYSSFPATAGHWLALACGLTYLTMALGRAFAEGLRYFTEPSTSVYVSIELAARLFQTGVWIYLTYAPLRSRAWRWFCILMATWTGVAGISALVVAVVFEFGFYSFDVLLTLTQGGLALLPSGLAVAGAVATVSDVKYQRSLDWLHWIGVAGALIGPLIRWSLFYAMEFFA